MALLFLLGSPPRVRGKAIGIVRDAEGDGITPACAGKSSARHWKRPATRDHPRVCGEKGKKPSQVTLEKGSPPRVRGKVLHQRPELCSHGITPACAGKRHPCKVYRVAVQDHPRVCGEKIITRARLTMWAGSPPRVRGKARRTPTQPRKPRITPACAGKSVGGALGSIVQGDHPRVCGEKQQRNLSCLVCKGSPPRVRGKDEGRCYMPLEEGITPACAGKSCAIRQKISVFWDHPRVCGEKTKKIP